MQGGALSGAERHVTTSCLILTLTPVLGSALEDVAAHMQKLADQLEVRVEARFNDKTLTTIPGADAQKIVDWYRMIPVL